MWQFNFMFAYFRRTSKVKLFQVRSVLRLRIWSSKLLCRLLSILLDRTFTTDYSQLPTTLVSIISDTGKWGRFSLLKRTERLPTSLLQPDCSLASSARFGVCFSLSRLKHGEE